MASEFTPWLDETYPAEHKSLAAVATRRVTVADPRSLGIGESVGEVVGVFAFFDDDFHGALEAG
jgi:hypothetical protein